MISAWALLAAAFWAALGLSWQGWASRRRSPAERAPASGNPGRGVVYSFTAGMLPSRKESVSRYPLSFSLGLVLHTGIAAGLLAAPGTVLFPRFLLAARPVFGAACAAGLAACLALFVRRLVSPDLRALSPADDYGANLAVGAFLAAGLALSLGWIEGGWFRWAAVFLLVYLPLGKLRHALFFFLARADQARRLGWRGVYPPAPHRS